MTVAVFFYLRKQTYQRQFKPHLSTLYISNKNETVTICSGSCTTTSRLIRGSYELPLITLYFSNKKEKKKSGNHDYLQRLLCRCKQTYLRLFKIASNYPLCQKQKQKKKKNETLTIFNNSYTAANGLIRSDFELALITLHVQLMGWEFSAFFLDIKQPWFLKRR